MWLLSKSLSDITSSFDKIKSDLFVFINNTREEVETLQYYITKASNEVSDKNEDILKANKIYANVSKLLGE